MTAMKKTTSNSIKRNLITALSLMMTATMLASCGSGYDGSESRKSGSYNNERTTAENYRYSNVTAGDTDGTANIGGGYNTEEYNHLTENGYKLVSDEPLSTFSTDVDTASYTNVRRMINDCWEVDPDAVRTEEFINYFKYDYEKPAEGAGKMQRIFRRTWDVKQSTVSTLPKIAARRFLMASIIRNWERS